MTEGKQRKRRTCPTPARQQALAPAMLASTYRLSVGGNNRVNVPVQKRIYFRAI